MKKMMKLTALLLAMLLLLTACGGTDTHKDSDKDKDEDTGPSINYEDYIDPVVDRRVADLISAESLSALMGVEVTLTNSTDSVATYQSENGYYMVTLALENHTRKEFDQMVEDVTIWTALEGVGEAAYWGLEQAELVAYQSGYAVSVSGYHVIPGCLESIMLRLLDGLQQ